MDITIFNEDVFAYDMDLETVSSLIRELKDDDRATGNSPKRCNAP